MSNPPEKRNIIVSTMLHVERIPDDAERDPHTLYIVSTGHAKRDHSLGQFLSIWSDLEGVLSSLFHVLLGSDYPTAGTVFAGLSGPNQVRELILALGEIRCDDQEQKQLQKICDKFKLLATKRNRLIHGRWISTVSIAGDHLDRPIVESFDWVRQYDPTSPTERSQIGNSKNQNYDPQTYSV